MYDIFSGGKLIAICDNPVYVKKQENGCYAVTDKKNARGVCVDGEVYNCCFSDGTSVLLDGVSKTATLKESDGSAYIARLLKELDEEKEKNKALTKAVEALISGDTGESASTTNTTSA